MPLWDQLLKILPDVLPEEPNKAINGTMLLNEVKPRLEGNYADATIRVHFSIMARDPTCPIAKVTTGHGYYLRKLEPLELEPGPPAARAEGEDAREHQPEEKFRAVFMRYAELQNHYPVKIEHTKAKRWSGGVNRWRFPDVVTVQWEVGEVTDERFSLDPHMLAVKASLGEQPFTLESVELKVGLSLLTFRENFFQCVSNSRWAHHATLAVANPIEDEIIIDELRRLGASYDVTILTYGLSKQDLEGLPAAGVIRQMSPAEFDEEIGKKINVRYLSTGKARPTLDWNQISVLRRVHDDFSSIFKWIADCLREGEASNYPED